MHHAVAERSQGAPNRQRILTAARELFATQGFGGTSMKEVARRAGVSQGLAYNYFASKDDLLRAIFEEGLADIRSTLPNGGAGLPDVSGPSGLSGGSGESGVSGVSEVPDRHDAGGTGDDAASPPEALAAIEELLHRSFAVVAHNQHLWRLLYALRVQPAVLARIGVELDGWGAAVEAELQRLCRRAGLGDPRVEAKLLFAVIDGANQHRTLSHEPYPVTELIEALMSKYRRQVTDRRPA